jgi:hypothetical protein
MFVIFFSAFGIPFIDFRKNNFRKWNFILILGRFAKANLLRMSYTDRNSIIKFANLFRFGIIEINRALR